MRIISLQAENLKRLVAVAIRPDQRVVQITGKNENGKTSVLDSIWWGLAGTRNVEPVPIRSGAERALIKMDLGEGDQVELRVTRTFTSKEDGAFTTSLIVENEAGTRLQQPQNVLDAVLGALTFEPLIFVKMKPADQFDTAKAFVSGVDFAALAREEKDDRDQRTTVNRRAKELRAQADGIVLPPGKVPARVDLAQLEKTLGDASEVNTLIERRKAGREAARDNILRMRDRVATLKAEVAGVEAALAEAETQYNGAEALPEPIDVTKVQGELQTARAGNAVAEKAAQKASVEAQARAAEEESIAITKKIEAREEGKQKAIAAAEMPVPGLGFGDECLLLDGLPFEQASGARKLRVSVAIAAALNPKLRVIRITDGSLLDDDAMQWLAEFAEEKDLQVWIERVDGSGRIGFVIENGMLKSDEPEEVI